MGMVKGMAFPKTGYANSNHHNLNYNHHILSYKNFLFAQTTIIMICLTKKYKLGDIPDCRLDKNHFRLLEWPGTWLNGGVISHDRNTYQPLCNGMLKWLKCTSRGPPNLAMISLLCPYVFPILNPVAWYMRVSNDQQEGPGMNSPKKPGQRHCQPQWWKRLGEF